MCVCVCVKHVLATVYILLSTYITYLLQPVYDLNTTCITHIINEDQGLHILFSFFRYWGLFILQMVRR